MIQQTLEELTQRLIAASAELQAAANLLLKLQIQLSLERMQNGNTLAVQSRTGREIE